MANSIIIICAGEFLYKNMEIYILYTHTLIGHLTPCSVMISLLASCAAASVNIGCFGLCELLQNHYNIVLYGYQLSAAVNSTDMNLAECYDRGLCISLNIVVCPLWHIPYSIMYCSLSECYTT